MQTEYFILADTDSKIREIAALAELIWNQHFVPIIGKEQVDYMVEKFQSYPALKNQIKHDGYEYYQIYSSGSFAGYIGIREESNGLFLSKLYIHQDFRGRHLATKAFRFLVNICRERSLRKIWLTCNKYNKNTLAVYNHLGFKVTDDQVADIGNGFVMDDYIMTYEVN